MKSFSVKGFVLKNRIELLILLLTVFIVWPLFLPGFFFHHDDLQVMRVFEMRKCFEDFQIPCRWVPDMGYGNGFPLFNYYSVLPYYIGAVFSYFGGFVFAAKVLFFIPLVLAGIAMFYLGRELFGDYGGFAAAVLYQFAPYRALDSYVRGAVAESFALAIAPLVFYFCLRLIKEKSVKNILGFSISLGLLLLSHNIMTLFFIPVLLIWIGIWVFKMGAKNLKSVVIGFLLGFGLAAFFIGPAFLEKSLVKTESLLMGGTEFRAHFVTVSQLFLNREWGYGGSFFGPDDTISFQIGWPHWWVVLLLPLGLVISKIGKWSNIKNAFLLSAYFLGIFLFSIFMTHNKSAPVWEMVSIVQYAQFPWRFLSLTIFSVSLIGGLLVGLFNGKTGILLALIMTILTVYLNFDFYKPKDFYPWVNDNVKLSEPLWEIQQKAGLADYLPKTVWLEPQGRAPDKPEIRKGKVNINEYRVFTNHFISNMEVLEDSTVEFPVFEFPNWTVFVNGKKTGHYYDKRWGRISLDLPPGKYQISAKLYDTWIRTAANLVSLGSLVLLVMIYKSANLRKRIF